jgi:hypothetical protein
MKCFAGTKLDSLRVIVSLAAAAVERPWIETAMQAAAHIQSTSFLNSTTPPFYLRHFHKTIDKELPLTYQASKSR